jgi:predicted ATP-grasp superfamily ATP-dependent carboligase
VGDNRALRESFRRIPETCPKANQAWKTLQRNILWTMDDDAQIKAVTNLVESYHDLNIDLRTALRNELTIVVEELIQAKVELEELEQTADELRSEIYELKSKLKVVA